VIAEDSEEDGLDPEDERRMVGEKIRRERRREAGLPETPDALGEAADDALRPS
jgi:hypothetical protein